MKNGRMHFLDSMRGIAALQVLCGHYYGAYAFPGGLAYSPIQFWRDGFAAVSFFFVLSGFVLSKSSFDGGGVRVGSFGDWCRYAMARAFRIHPAFWFAMLLSFLLLPFNAASFATSPAPSDWIQKIWSSSPSTRDLVINVTLMAHKENLLIPQAWTLTIEFLLSLLLPMATLLAVYSLPMFLACMALLLFRLELQQFFFHFSLGIFLAGCWRFPMVRRALEFRGIRLALLAVGGYLYAIRFGWPVGLPDGWAWHLTGLGAFCILLAVLYDTKAQTVLIWRPLRVLGRISYSVYLLHFIVLLVVTPRAIMVLNKLGLNEGWLPWGGGLATTILVTVLASWFSQRYVEEPAHKWGKILVSRYWPDSRQKNAVLFSEK